MPVAAAWLAALTCPPCNPTCSNPPAAVCAGLKRYFHAKRMEGLLSSRGLRILDAACESALEAPAKPLNLWCTISRCV